MRYTWDPRLLLFVFGPSHGNIYLCPGPAGITSSRACLGSLSQADVDEITTMMGEMAREPPTPAQEEQLQRLARLCLCPQCRQSKESRAVLWRRFQDRHAVARRAYRQYRRSSDTHERERRALQVELKASRGRERVIAWLAENAKTSGGQLQMDLQRAETELATKQQLILNYIEYIDASRVLFENIVRMPRGHWPRRQSWDWAQRELPTTGQPSLLPPGATTWNPGTGAGPVQASLPASQPVWTGFADGGFNDHAAPNTQRLPVLAGTVQPGPVHDPTPDGSVFSWETFSWETSSWESQ